MGHVPSLILGYVRYLHSPMGLGLKDREDPYGFRALVKIGSTSTYLHWAPTHT
jgi:hypothetical protein